MSLRQNRLIALLESIDRRTQTEEDSMAMNENTIQDRFFPISEKLSLTDSVDIAYYDPTTFAWGGNRALLTPTFARTGVAYSPETGLPVQANEPRYVSGKFDMGVVVEEGTTNLVSNPFFDGTYVGGLAPNWTKFGTPTVDENTDRAFVTYGSKSQHVVAAAASQGVFQSFTVTNGVQYIAKLRVYVVSGVVRLDARFGATFNAVATTKLGWNELTVTRPATDGTSGIVYAYSQNGPAEFYVDAAQYEQKAYATSFTVGTRAPETLTLPTTGLMPTQGTIAAWVYVNSVARRQGTYNGVFHAPAATGSGYLLLTHVNAAASWRLLTYDGVTVKSNDFADSSTPDGWHRFVLRYSASEANVFVDGVKRATIALPTNPSSFAASLHIGRFDSGYLNVPFDNVVLSSVAWSDADVAADYASGVPYVANANTLAVVNFDGSLKGESFFVEPNFDWNGGGVWNAS